MAVANTWQPLKQDTLLSVVTHAILLFLFGKIYIDCDMKE